MSQRCGWTGIEALLKDYFATVIEYELARAEERCREDFADTIETAISDNALGNSGIWLARQEILRRNLEVLGQRLALKLNEIDAEHSPIRDIDFKATKDAVTRFKKRCEKLYEELGRESQQAYRSTKLPFNHEGLHRTEIAALNEIDGALAVFKSKRSFWKWALGDLRRRIWSGGLLLVGTFIGGFFSHFFKSV